VNEGDITDSIRGRDLDVSIDDCTSDAGWLWLCFHAYPSNENIALDGIE
jgi:hypothetical protein